MKIVPDHPYAFKYTEEVKITTNVTYFDCFEPTKPKNKVRETTLVICDARGQNDFILNSVSIE